MGRKECFFGQNIAGGVGGGGRRDEPKADQKIVIRSRALCNNYLEWLFLASGLAASRETSESATGQVLLFSIVGSITSRCSGK